jgi:hypothetical protein
MQLTAQAPGRQFAENWRNWRSTSKLPFGLKNAYEPGSSRFCCDEPPPIVDIEFYQTFVSHFQQEGLASFLIGDIGAFHDFVDFERLLAERAQDIFSIIQHDCSLQNEPF